MCPSSIHTSLQTTRLASAGKGWFDMPAPILTPALKNDLKLLRMRNALDPSRHYKANDSKQLPRYFQARTSLTSLCRALLIFFFLGPTTHTRTHTYVYTHTHVHTRMCTHTHTRTHTYVYTHVHTRMCTHTHVHRLGE